MTQNRGLGRGGRATGEQLDRDIVARVRFHRRIARQCLGLRDEIRARHNDIGGIRA